MVATLQGWQDYADVRGRDVPVGELSNAALVRAQDYIAYRYLNRMSAKVQPPEDLVDRAIYEAARYELETPGFFSRTFTADQQKVLTQVENIKWEVRGTASGSDAASPVSTLIDQMMWPYMVRRAGLYVA